MLHYLLSFSTCSTTTTIIYHYYTGDTAPPLRSCNCDIKTTTVSLWGYGGRDVNDEKSTKKIKKIKQKM